MILTVLKNIMTLLFPRVCLACYKVDVESDRIFCQDCLFHIPYTDDFTNATNKVMESFFGKLRIKEGAALLYFDKAGVVQHMMHQFKYNRKPEIGRKMGKIAAEKALEGNKFKEVDVVIPIPLHPIKMARRGYNQSEIFGQSFAYSFNKTFIKCLKKNKNTDSQTRKTRIERLNNVAGSIEIIDAKLIQNKHILLVDDVVTTGATLEVSAKVLLEAGAASISVLVLASAR